jgi:RNA polymerase sigma factor (sigma-70 family)
MMNQRPHDEWTGKIIASINRELDAEESALFNNHVQTCSQCTQALREYELLSRRLYALERNVAVPTLSPALLALKQEIAQQRIQEEAQHVAKQVFAQEHDSVGKEHDSSSERKAQQAQDPVYASSGQGAKQRITESSPYLSRPRADDRIVVEEMLRDSKSGQWHECYLSIKRLVQVQAKNIPEDHWDDIAQDAMMRVHKYLSTFQYQCMFRTWLFGIVRSCIINDYRKSSRAGLHMIPLADPHTATEHEGDAFTPISTRTVEDLCITHDDLNKAVTTLKEYVSMHSHPIRNGRILDMVIFEGHSLEKTAKAVGCSAPVVGYVVRSAQRYVREKLGYHK